MYNINPKPSIPTLNWKDRGDRRYDALASRTVGGKYFIYWCERYYSEDRCEWLDICKYRIDYRTKGGGTIGNVDRTAVRTLKSAKAIAEFDHEKRKELIRKYGARAPEEAWSKFNREMLEFQQHICADITTTCAG
jgi:hypothetical protein